MYPLYVEVGCRGYVGKTFDYVKRVLGFTKAEARQLKQTMEYTALLCSYTIFNHRYIKKWEEKAPLDVSW